MGFAATMLGSFFGQADAIVRLTLYSPVSGKRESSVVIRHDSLQHAVESAVRDGYLSGRDFHVTFDDGRDDSPMIWNGFHHQAARAMTDAGTLRPATITTIEKQLARLAERV